MIVSRLAVDVLLQTGQGSEGLDMTVLQVILSLSDVSCVVRNRMGDIIAGHRGDAKDRDGTCAFDIHRLLVSGGKAAVQIARVTTIGRHLLHRDRHFLLGVGEVRHIGQQHQNSLSDQGKLLCHCQGHIRHQSTFHDGVCRGVDEHDGMAHGAALLQGVAELHVIVIFQAHAAEDDDIDLCLHGDSRQELVVRLTGDGEDRQLLALDQGVEHVDHRNTGTNHVLGKNTLRRVERRSADGNHVFCKSRTVVSRNTCAVKNTAEQIFRKRDHHGSAEETDRIRCADALGAGKDLKGDLVLVQLDYARVTVTHQRKVGVSDALCADGNDVTDN